MQVHDPEGILFRKTYDQTVDGKQIQILSYLGRKWGVGDPRFTEEQVVKTPCVAMQKETRLHGTYLLCPMKPYQANFMKQLHTLEKG